MDHIPVYIGEGIEYKEKYDDELRKDFIKNNSKFPFDIFGFPIGTYKDGEKIWFPDFFKGFYVIYGKEYCDTFKADGKADIYLIETLAKYSPENKLRIILISPPHDIAKIPIEFYKNIDLWAMGGGFDDGIISDNLIRQEYNWGISPENTKKMLEKLNKTNTKIKLISSSLIRNLDIIIHESEYKEICNLIEKKNIKLYNAILKDWEYSNKGNKLIIHKNLCDPTIVILSMNMIEFTSNIVLYEIINDTTYIDYLNTKNMKMKYDINGNCIFINDIKNTKLLIEKILESINYYCV